MAARCRCQMLILLRQRKRSAIGFTSGPHRLARRRRKGPRTAVAFMRLFGCFVRIIRVFRWSLQDAIIASSCSACFDGRCKMRAWGAVKADRRFVNYECQACWAWFCSAPLCCSRLEPIPPPFFVRQGCSQSVECFADDFCRVLR